MIIFWEVTHKCHQEEIYDPAAQFLTIQEQPYVLVIQVLIKYFVSFKLALELCHTCKGSSRFGQALFLFV